MASVLKAAAVILVVLRLLAPFEVGKDQASQIDTARRLVAGQGFTTTEDPVLSDLDVSTVPTPRRPTWWPPGLSLVLAPFFWVGLPLAATLKLVYSVVTLVGWWGWAAIAKKAIADFPPMGRPLRAVGLVAAALTPFWFTPPWSGTDVFLWAGVPWVLLLTNRPALDPHGVVAAASAGLVVGVLFAMRYASAFLGLAAGLILLQAAWPHFRILLRRFVAFGVAALLVAVPVVVFMKGGQVPVSGMYDDPIESSEVSTVTQRAPHAAQMILGSPVLDRVLAKVSWSPLTHALGVATLLVILATPCLLWKAGRRRWTENTALPLALLPAALVVFLIVVSRGWFLGVARYYQPLLLCGALVCSTVVAAGVRHAAASWAARVVLTLFLAYLCAFVPAMALVPSQRPVFLSTVLSFSGRANSSVEIGYPGWGRVFTRKEASRAKVAELFQRYPQALFFATNYPLYIFDRMPAGPTAGIQFRDLPDDAYWKTAHSSVSRKIFLVAETTTPLPWIRARKEVYRDPRELTVIYEISVEPGQILGADMEPR